MNKDEKFSTNIDNWTQQFMKESNTMIKLDLLQGHKNSLTHNSQSM